MENQTTEIQPPEPKNGSYFSVELQNSPMELEFPNLKLQKETENIGGKTVNIIHFIGKITNENSHTVNQKIHRIIEGQVYNVVLDLSKLEYINSSGVAILFHILSWVREKQGIMLVGGVHRFLRRVFGLMDLPSEISLYDDLEDAKNSFLQ